MDDQIYELVCGSCQKVLGTTSIKKDEKHLCGDCGITNLNTIQILRDHEQKAKEGKEAILELLWKQHLEKEALANAADNKK